MLTLASGSRPVLKWLLTPLLVVIDRRIGARLQESRERLARVERELAAIKEYVQLVAGALAPSPDSMTASQGEPASPEPDGETLVTWAPESSVGNVPAAHLERLACPVCRAHVRVVPEIVTSDGRIKHGYVPCPGCKQVIAQIRDFRVDFRAPGGALPERVRPPRTIPDPGELRIAFDDTRLHPAGDWASWDDRFMVSHGAVTDSLEYRGRFTDALVHMVTQPEGGIVDFFVDGRLTGTADLYGEHWFVLPHTMASNLLFAEHVLRIQPRGTRSPRSTGTDILVAELVLSGPRTDPCFEAPRPINRGNPYMHVFERCIGEVPADELILEVGGGERRRLRPGYINLEHLSVEFADVYGDVHHLPFWDDTFRLVLAQAVFEHVANPFLAAAELIRVARPGGLIVADVAFMQPLHAAPYHYFNMTAWGIQELFKSCSIVECDYYDGLAGTVEWMLRSVGAHRTVSDVEFAAVIDGVRAMETKLSHADIRPATSGYYVVARKPAPASQALIS